MASETHTKRLEGRRALVTGGASGIGRASAVRLAAEGAYVLVTDITEGIHETVQSITDAGGAAEARTVDAADNAAVADAVKGMLDGGGIDIFFANAGITGEMVPVTEADEAEWTRVLRVNLMSVAFAIRHAGRPMKEQGSGSIICTASVAGLRAGAGPSPYSASKAAVINVVQTSAAHLGQFGVRLNAICPGLIETGMTKPIFDYARSTGKTDRIGHLNPMRRGGQPEEIASVVAFLASDDASYVNGQAIAIDGGLSATHPFMKLQIF